MGGRYGRILGWGLLPGLLILAGCHRKRKTVAAPKSDAYADQIKAQIAQPALKVMHWPNYANYQPAVQTFYDGRNDEVAWVEDNGQPSRQAAAFIQAFSNAGQKGLNPQDYDAGLWEARVAKLPGKNPDDVASFDAAMTVSVMRYLSDLHNGRVNPTFFNFQIDTQSKQLNLPEFLATNAVGASDIPGLIASVEPDSEQYRQTEAALVKYTGLAAEQAGTEPLPTVTSPVSPGGQYSDVGALRARLQLEGDLPGGEAPDGTPAQAPIPHQPRASAPSAGGKVKQEAGKLKGELGSALHRVEHKAVPSGSSNQTSGQTAAASASGRRSPAPAAAPPIHHGPGVYSAELAAGVRHYQQRHGLEPNGTLTAATIGSLNVPLSARTQQLADSLERLRWLPAPYLNAPLQVNLPEFVLRGFGPDHAQQFKMNVVVGEVEGQHETPVFTHMMKYLVFRPFWNIPISIIKKDLVPHIDKSGIGYLASHDFQTVDSKGQEVHPSPAEVVHGDVVVRQKPGPKNALGLIKFMFPNEYDIYLHSTPQPYLFARRVRDFSHGCVRVQHPDDLAVWVLKNSDTSGDWDLQKVQDAMNSGPDNHTVSLAHEIPITIFYATARVAEDGSVDFFDDLYGYDKQLDDVLSKGMPYPSEQRKVNPNTKFGDTT